MAMAGGSFHASRLTIAWPTGEIGATGLEGAVRLAFRKELAAIADEAQRQQRYEELVALAYARGRLRRPIDVAEGPRDNGRHDERTRRRAADRDIT